MSGRSGRRGDGHPAGPRGTRALVAATGALPRSLEYWLSIGLLGEHHRTGSGGRREFSDSEFEVVWTLARLANIGCLQEAMAAAARAVAARPVAREGEVLVLYPDGRAHRFDKHACIEPGTDPCWVVPLRPAPDLSTNENTPAAGTARAS